MDTSDKSDILKKYTRQQYPALVKPAPDNTNETGEPEQDEASGYRALIEHREKKGNAPRFRIVDRNGQSHGCGYAYLLGWLYAPPDTLTLTTTTHVFVLSGKNLHRIENALMRERVKQLQEFRPDHDTVPADGEPIITHLDITIR